MPNGPMQWDILGLGKDNLLHNARLMSSYVEYRHSTRLSRTEMQREDPLSIRSRLWNRASLDEIKRVYPAATKEQRMTEQFGVSMHVAEFICVQMSHTYREREVVLYLAVEYIREGCKMPAGRFSGPAHFIRKLLESTKRYPENLQLVLDLVPMGLIDPEEEIDGLTLTEHAYRIGGATVRDQIMAATAKRRRIEVS